MLSRTLEETLLRALDLAGARGQKHAMLEHLLLALTEDKDAVAVLPLGSGKLNKMRQNLISFLDRTRGTAPVEANPTTGFQRAVRRAELHADEAGIEATGANVLLAIFFERETPALSFLEEQGLTRFDLKMPTSADEPTA